MITASLASASDPAVLFGFVALYVVLSLVVVRFATGSGAGGEPRRPRRCPYCGHRHDPSYRYCERCVSEVPNHR